MRRSKTSTRIGAPATGVPSRVDHHRVRLQVAALERPALAAQPGQPGAGPAGGTVVADGLRLAVGIAELQLGQQLARRVGARQQHQAAARGARGVEGQLSAAAAPAAYRRRLRRPSPIAEHARAHRAVREGVRVESVGCGKTARSQLAAQHDGQAGGRPAGEVSDGRGRRATFLRGDQRARRGAAPRRA